MACRFATFVKRGDSEIGIKVRADARALSLTLSLRPTAIALHVKSRRADRPGREFVQSPIGRFVTRSD